MAKDFPYNYGSSNGAGLFIYKDLTTHDIAKVCKDISKTLGKGYCIIPEPISEGGLLWLNYPGKKAGEYKSMRLGCCNGSNWPIITDWTETGADTWLNQPAEILSSVDVKYLFGKKVQPKKLSIFFKAFYGAPVFTVHEISTIQDAFDNVNIPIKIKIPKIEYGKLGMKN